MSADATSTDDAACAIAITNLENVATVSCTRGAVDATNGATYTITFTSFPMIPRQNNFFYHDGNPPLGSFTCDISSMTGGVTPTCTIADSVASNLKE
jgi:hypothetical protein